MSWRLVFTKQAQKDAKKLASSGLKPKARELLEILAEDPFQKPPYEKVVGDLSGAYSRRINIQTSVGVWGAGKGASRQGFVVVESLRVESALQNSWAKK